jgi:hypothetical protein
MNSTSSLVCQVIPPRTAVRDLPALETAMQALALDTRHPIALEIAGSATARLFLIRATSRPALEHLSTQLYAHYPQATLLPLSAEQDPLRLCDDEAISALELTAGAASYLPLRRWRERELTQEGTDPVLGLLAALGQMPPEMRVIAQLALVPAPQRWSQTSQRLSVEHPLEQERMRERYRSGAGYSSGPSASSSIGLLVLAAIGFLVLRLTPFLRKIIPPWAWQAGLQMLHGKMAHLTVVQESILTLWLVGTLVAIVLLFILIDLIRRHFRRTRIYDMRLVQQKTSHLAYRARLRLYVIGPGTKKDLISHIADVHTWQEMASRGHVFWHAWSEQRAQAEQRREILARLVAAYRQYHLSSGGYFVPRRLTQGKARRKVRHPQHWWHQRTGWYRRVAHSPHYLGVGDVAHLWHLVQGADLPEVPLLERGRARTLLAPASLSRGGGWRIGTSTHAGHHVPVYLPWDTLRSNLFAVASTGKGKSTLFLHLAEAALAANAAALDGLLVMEPHRDLIEMLLERIPRARREDVVLVDLADVAYPVGLNVLDATLGRDRDKTIANLVAIFGHIWAASWGPRTENVLETCLKTLAEANATMVKADSQTGPDRQYTLLDIVPLLRNWNFRQSVLEQVHDRVLTGWWQLYYEPMDLRHQTEVIGSVVNKMSKYASSLTARRILGQPRSTVNLAEIVQHGKVLLVSAASGIVGEDIAALVGATILGLFQAALAEQVQLPLQERRHFLVLVDEFQFFGGANYQAGLAELRKMGGHFGLATQSLDYLDKLDRTLRSTVLANVDHLFAFAMCGADAHLLERELQGVDVGDLTTLDDFQYYARLSLDRRRLPIFSLTLDPPSRGDAAQAISIRRLCQQRDAHSVEAVDAMISQAIARHALTASRKTSHRIKPGVVVEQADQDTHGMSVEGGQKKTHAPRTKKAQGSDGVSSLHLIYDQPGVESVVDASEEGGEHA